MRNKKMLESIFIFGIFLMSGLFVSAEVPLRGFGQIGYINKDTDTNGIKENTNSFYNGTLDLFLTTNISKKINFLAEIGFEMTESNQTGVDIERLTVQYVASPWFKIGAGRFHTALGYWNDNYHHGGWLHTTTERPLIYRFEDDGGVLPTHSEGVEIRGEGDFGSGQLGYIFNFANGRNAQVDPPQIANDKDKSKAANLLVFYKFGNVDGLRLGALYYEDSLPGCTYDSTITDPAQIANCTYTAGPATLRAKGKEKIYGAHIVWAPQNFETIIEYFNLIHSYESTDVNSKINGGYAQFSYSHNEWTPYYRYDYIEVPDSIVDAYTNREGTTTGQTIGARWDFDPTSSLKFEYFISDLKHSNSALGTDKTNLLSANWNFTF